MKSDQVFQLLLVPAIMLSSFDNFRVEALLDVLLCCYLEVKLLIYALPVRRILSTCPAHMWIYIDTAALVLISYMLLLSVNLSYLWLAIFPFIAIAFTFAMCNELRRRPSNRGHEVNSGSSSSSADTDYGEKEATKELELRKAIATIPLLMICVTGQFHHAADRFTISLFLLFLDSTLEELALMMLKLRHAGVSPGPGIAPASELLHKTSLVAQLVMVHTVAAELLGEDVILLCLPEVAPVLLWFSVHLDRGGSVITVGKIKSQRNGLIVLGAVVAAVLAYLAASMDGSGLSRCTTALVSCGVSGLLIYFVVSTLRQWPGQAGGKAGTSLEEAVQLLRFWANALLITAAALLVIESVVAVRLGLHK